MVADLIVDLFFATDIIMTFFVAYFDRRTYLLVDRRKSIVKRLVDFAVFNDMKKILSVSFHRISLKPAINRILLIRKHHLISFRG